MIVDISSDAEEDIIAAAQSRWVFRSRSVSQRRRRLMACLSGVLDQPASEAFGDLTRRGFGILGRRFAIAANPLPLSNGLADELDAMRRPTAFFQADAYVGGKSGPVFDPSEVGTASLLSRSGRRFGDGVQAETGTYPTGSSNPTSRRFRCCRR
jgi:hypothetical protein